MKFKLSCFNKSTDSFFQDVITVESSIFTSLEAVATALRGMYGMSAPDVEVVQIVRLEEMERGDY